MHYLVIHNTTSFCLFTIPIYPYTMRVVLDTNVLIDGFQDEYSAQARLIKAVSENKLTALVTPKIEREYRNILRRLISDPEYKERIQEFLKMTEETEPAFVETQIDDEEDRKFIQAAVGGQADLIVSNDRHLLDIGEVGSTRIVTPKEAWNIFQDDSGGGSEWKNFIKNLGIGLVILTIALTPITTTHAQEEVQKTPAQIAKDKAIAELAEQRKQIETREKEITEINKNIKDLEGKKNTVKGQADIIANQIAVLNIRLKKSEIELRQTKTSITKVQSEQGETEGGIQDVQKEITEKKQQLKSLLRLIYEKEQESLIRIFFNSWSLSEVLAERAAYKELQDRAVSVIAQMHEKKDDLQEHHSNLEQQEEDMSNLEEMLEEQKKDVANQKSEQKVFLTKKKEEQVTYENKIKEATEVRKEIEKKLFTLKSGEIEVSLTSAFDMAKFASSFTGVRPALLLAVLKVESNTGKNVGSGNYPDDMHPQSRDAFVRISKKLDFDPYTQKISRKPASGKGWGGAMGPAQIMPATWEGIEGRLEKLANKSPVSPFDLTDAFGATGIFLADRGAADPVKEREATGRYIAGPNWQYYSWYVDKVMAVAAEYEKEL